MKRSRHDFEQPTRQHFVAIIMIIYKFYKGLVRQAFPFLLLFFVGNKSRRAGVFLPIALSIIGLLGTIYGILAFFKYYFYLEEDELVIKSGVFGRKLVNIPFERIQTIDFEQNIVHQVFNVVALKIDTAGSAKSEFKFDALDRRTAEELRTLILQKKKNLLKTSAVEELEEELLEENAETIFSLSPLDLLKVGITENHFRSFWLIIATGLYFMQSVDDLGFDVWNYFDDFDQSMIFKSIALLLGAVVFFIVISFLYSLIRTILRYFNLKFQRTDSGFKIIAGLFNRREVAARDTKIQIMNWSQNLLQKFIKLYEINLKQASSVQVKSKKSIIVPGTYMQQVDDVQKYLFRKKELQGLEFNGVSIHFFYRKALYLSLAFLVIAALVVLIGKPYALIFVIPVFLLWILSSYLAYKKKKYAVNAFVLQTNGGVYGHGHSLMKLFKVQSVKIKRNLYQRRRGLSTVIVYTATGGLSIPYIAHEKALELMDYFLYRVETSKAKWM